MRNTLVEESPHSILLKRLHALAVKFTEQVDDYACLQTDQHLHVARATSQHFLTLSTYVANKRLKPFCKELDRCCTLLATPAGKDAAGCALLIKTGQLLSASLSDPEEGVQAQYLTVEAFDLLRSYRPGAPNFLRKVQSLRVRVLTKKYWRCLHLSVRKILHQMLNDSETISASDASVQSTILLLCFERFTDFPLEPAWENKSEVLKLLFVECVSASLASSAISSSGRQKKLLLRRLVHEQACRRLLILIVEKLQSLLLLGHKVDAAFLITSERKTREALLGAQWLCDTQNTIALSSALEVTRSHIRTLQCWFTQVDLSLDVLLLCVSSATQSLVSMLKPSAIERISSVKSLDLEQRCEIAGQKIYRQLQAESVDEIRFTHCLQENFQQEILSIENILIEYRNRGQKQNAAVSIETDVFWALTRIKSGAFCVRDFALYESACWVLRLYCLAIERRITLRREFTVLLPQLIGIAQERDRRKKQKRCELFNMALAREELVTRQISSTSSCVRPEQLGDFLSNNIRELLIYPEQLNDKPQEVRTMVAESRRCILELNMLSAGARKLNVDRVAELAEALEQTHGALCALPDLTSVDLPTLLGPAHQSLRESLNRAAARQHVEDKRAVIADLYLFLERSLPLVAPKWRRRGLRQRSQQLVNHLDSNLGTVEALMKTHALAQMVNKNPLFERLVQEQRSLLQQLQEELGEAQLVRFVRVRARLQRFVARQANQAGTLVRLQVHNEGLQFRRAIIASLMAPLQQLLRIIIEQGIEDEAVRRLRRKPKAGVISMQVHQQACGIRVDLSDDGQAIALSEIQSVQHMLHSIGGELNHAYLPLQGNRLKLELAN